MTATATPTILEEALRLAGLGYPVFPCHAMQDGRCTCGKADCNSPGKHPRTRHGLKDATTDPARIHEWDWTAANLAVVTGAVSGFIAIDVDPRHDGDRTLERLLQTHGPLPDTVTQATGGGGRHFLFQHPGWPVKNDGKGKRLGPGIDIRGDSGYILVPPSWTKGEYRWLDGRAPWDVPLAPLPTWLADSLSDGACRDTRRVSERSETSENSEAMNGSDVSDVSEVSELSEVSDTAGTGGSEVSDTLERVMQASLPTKPGERNERVLRLARGLRFDCGMGDRPLPELKPIVRKWHTRALPNMTTKGFTETWSDFCHAWPRVRVPLLQDVLGAALSYARAHPVPEGADYDEPVRTLVAVCKILAERWGKDGTFFLGSHNIAARLNIPQPRAYRHLRMLATDELIAVVKTGNEHSATRYRWLGALGGS